MNRHSMRNAIHPSAILEGNIEMGSGNTIGPNVVLKGNITLGDDNTISTGTMMVNHVDVGSSNSFYPYTAIGAIGEMGAKGDRFAEGGKIVIGNQVTLREYTCVHAPVKTKQTQIEDNVYVMNRGYIAHDVVIGKGAVLNAGVMLAGNVHVEPLATIGMGAAVHQRLTIGASSMIGMQTPVTRNILPFAKVAGSPARILGFNRIAAERQGIDEQWIMEMIQIFSKDVMLNNHTDNAIMKQVSAFLSAHPGSLILHKY